MSIRTDYRNRPVIREFACTRCQCYHRQEIEPDLYKDHIMSQSKHGTSERLALPEEVVMLERIERMRESQAAAVYVHLTGGSHS